MLFPFGKDSQNFEPQIQVRENICTFNALILADVDEIFAHVFRENPDKTISYLSSISSNAGKIKEII